MLEDESGRIRLVGEQLKDARIVTGVIMGALGMETPNGEFEVLDYCFAEMASQHSGDDVQTDDMEIDAGGELHQVSIVLLSEIWSLDQDTLGDWIAVVSGLDIGSDITDDSKIQMLVEYLTGEVGGTVDQKSAAQISRLVVAGNSLVPIIEQIEPALERRPVCQNILAELDSNHFGAATANPGYWTYISATYPEPLSSLI
jgi:DNA polymerase delta subunit 2